MSLNMSLEENNEVLQETSPVSPASGGVTETEEERMNRLSKRYDIPSPDKSNENLSGSTFFVDGKYFTIIKGKYDMDMPKEEDIVGKRIYTQGGDTYLEIQAKHMKWDGSGYEDNLFNIPTFKVKELDKKDITDRVI